MYIPNIFKQEDKIKSIAFMRTYNFAILISSRNNIPIATHLPFIIEEREHKLFLCSHLSKSNEQWQSFLEDEVLIVFSEPHAYISPSLYEKKQNVPTWNYVAVHAYGKVKLIDDVSEQYLLLEKMMLNLEPSYLEQWKTLDTKYKEGLRNGIVCFEVEVTKLQSKEKLSQNKSNTEKENIIQHLEKQPNTQQQDIAKMMKRKK